MIIKYEVRRSVKRKPKTPQKHKEKNTSIQLHLMEREKKESKERTEKSKWGEISVISEKGKGSEFIILLPINNNKKKTLWAKKSESILYF